jgi:hypothetical protein
MRANEKAGLYSNLPVSSFCCVIAATIFPASPGEERQFVLAETD